MRLQLSNQPGWFSILVLVSLLMLPDVRADIQSRALQVRVLEPGESIAVNSPLTPLGSLWKLYVYAYQVENQLPELTYTCSGQDPEEIFCCKPKETVARDRALAQSCTPYFLESVKGVGNKQWADFWQRKINKVPRWLTDLQNLKPERRVPVDEILFTLLEIRQKFSQSDRIVAGVAGTVLQGTARNALNTWGSTLKVKTYTWRDTETMAATDGTADALGFTGGFAGWLPDGAAIWVSGAGHGRDFFLSELKGLVNSHMQKSDTDCVNVNYFSQYPIKAVQSESDRLTGLVKIKFKNGNQVEFNGDGSLVVNKVGKQIKISGQMGLNEYVARVIDREIQPTPLEAARAFSLAIRTFLIQNSQFKNGCRTISDSSHAQRVSPSAASSAALAIARWSEGLFLEGVDQLRYHSNKEGVNRMSWVKAKSLAESDFRMTEILKSAYPTSTITFGSLNQAYECRPNVMTEKWISQQSKQWWRRLDREAGFERPTQLKICQSNYLQKGITSRVFSHPQAQQIFVPHVLNHDDEVSVLHEYLHIGFRFHPRGQDELFVENMARKLLEEE